MTRRPKLTRRKSTNISTQLGCKPLNFVEGIIIHRGIGTKSNRNHRDLPEQFAYQNLEPRHLLAGASYHPNELLIQYLPQDSTARASIRGIVAGEVLETVQSGPMAQAGFGALERVHIGNGMTVEQAVARIKELPGVMYAEPNYVIEFYGVSDDTRYVSGEMWGVYSDDNPVQIGPSGTTNQFGTQAEEVWDNVTTGSKEVYVAVLDSGTDVNHEDLQANIFHNPFDAVDGVDNDGNGKVDDFTGWNFEGDTNDPFDDVGHGTHVSGTVAARGGNGLGTVGINWDVNLIPCKIGGQAGPSITAAISAFDYLIDMKQRHDLNIVATNNSWGGTQFSQALLDAIVRAAEADILVICASGNDGTNNDSAPHYPSNYDTTADAGYDAVISVASIDSDGGMSSFSNFGIATVDIAAPGSGIWSTQPGNAYASLDGTSMASPHVTGAAALFVAANPTATAQEIRAAIFAAAAPTTSLAGQVVTGGRLDLSALVVSAGPETSIDDVSIVEGNSGTKQLVFTVTLAETWGSEVSINFATSGLSATSGLDFQAKSGTITFDPGEVTQTIAVNIIGDVAFEPTETFRVTLSSPVNAKLVKSVGIGSIMNDDPHVIGETGLLTLNSNWRTVNFKRPIANPVIIMGTPSNSYGDPVTMRVRNVKPAQGSFMGSFEVRVEEWDYRDGIHGVENVSYMVFERGRHVLQNGAVIVAGTSVSNHQFADFTFGQSAGFQSTPVVLTQVMTTNELSAVTTRIKNVSTSGFSMRLQEEQASDRIHRNETFGWVAIETGRLTGNGLDSEVVVTPPDVTDANYRVHFQPDFAKRPAFFAQMQTYNGGDPANVRYDQLSFRSARFFLQEERSADAETSHNGESVGYFAFQSGLIEGVSAPQIPAMLLSSASGSDSLTPAYLKMTAAAFAIGSNVLASPNTDSTNDGWNSTETHDSNFALTSGLAATILPQEFGKTQIKFDATTTANISLQAIGLDEFINELEIELELI